MYRDVCDRFSEKDESLADVIEIEPTSTEDILYRVSGIAFQAAYELHWPSKGPILTDYLAQGVVWMAALGILRDSLVVGDSAVWELTCAIPDFSIPRAPLVA